MKKLFILVLFGLLFIPSVWGCVERELFDGGGEVIELISPLLPKDKRINILHGDVIDFHNEKYDTVILDLWVKSNGTDLKRAGEKKGFNEDMNYTFHKFKLNNLNAKIFAWGCRDLEINPAVTKKPNEAYFEFIRKLKEAE